MQPTVEEINKLAAEACGWTEIEPDYAGRLQGRNPEGRVYPYVPNYCTDRNALPELLDMVFEKGSPTIFSHEFRHLCIEHLQERWQKSKTFAVASAPALLVTVAALRALGKWPDDAEVLEGENGTAGNDR